MMNFSVYKGRMLACKMPSPVALEDIAKSRCFIVGLVTGDKWQNDHGDTTHKKMTGDNWLNDHGDNSQGQETGSSCNRCSRRLGPKAFTRTERNQKFKKNHLRSIWCCDTTKKAQKQYWKKVAKYKSNVNWKGSRCNDVEVVDQLFGTNEVEIKQKTLGALRLLRQADHALNEVVNTSTILPRTCEPEGPLVPRKSAKEKLEMSSDELTRKKDGCLSQLFSASHI
jgi:hypothetical protein